MIQEKSLLRVMLSCLAMIDILLTGILYLIMLVSLCVFCMQIQGQNFHGCNLFMFLPGYVQGGIIVSFCQHDVGYGCIDV